jgi:tetratricopeptide (TPR) repeat protein
MTRLEQLHQFFQEDPTDPFNLYALAIEYQKHNAAKAQQYFEQLMNEHENYLPVYYTLGKFYADTGDTDHAIQTFEKGIEKAKAQNETKTHRELKSALDELMY